MGKAFKTCFLNTTQNKNTSQFYSITHMSIALLKSNIIFIVSFSSIIYLTEIKCCMPLCTYRVRYFL